MKHDKFEFFQYAHLFQVLETGCILLDDLDHHTKGGYLESLALEERGCMLQ